jgi:hypothetical protein
MTVAIDIDGTLFTVEGKLNQKVVDLAYAFKVLGAEVYFWSGGGKQYVEQRLRDAHIELSFEARDKLGAKEMPDLAIDDQEVQLGIINFQV